MLDMFLPTRSIVVLLVAAIVIAGCSGKNGLEFTKVELHRSATQTLIVRNLTGNDIIVRSADANSSSITIKAGNGRSIDFVVVTKAKEDKTGVFVAGSEQNQIEAIGGTSYFRLIGEDWVLAAGPPGDTREYAFFLGQCWFNEPAESRFHRLEVLTSSIQVLPVAICP